MSSIVLSNVHVAYPVYASRSRSLKNRVMSAATGGRIGSDQGSRLCVNALQGVNIAVSEGERVALIGHNGAGKTTLLRVLAGIYSPQVGTVDIYGNVSPMFDISFGIDPELSGYENIRLRSLYLGIQKEVVDENLQEIGDFSDLGEYLELPVRMYSSGMIARLSFAIATSVNPDILLLDEGIGAGDAHFVQKMNSRLEAFIKRSGILILASHNESLISRFCERAIVLSQGTVVDDGPIAQVLDRYRA